MSEGEPLNPWFWGVVMRGVVPHKESGRASFAILSDTPIGVEELEKIAEMLAAQISVLADERDAITQGSE